MNNLLPVYASIDICCKCHFCAVKTPASVNETDRLPLTPSTTPRTEPDILSSIFYFVGTESFSWNGSA